MKSKDWTLIVISLISLFLIGNWAFKNYNFNPNYEVGQKIDRLNGISVYYNGGVSNVTERNMSIEGYNYGLKYQCVEYVKRYYYEHLGHEMPDSYGNAIDFFNSKLNDSELNKQRGLYQFTNPSSFKPELDDLVVYSGTLFNKYGHVAIVSEVFEDKIEIIQQNAGPFSKTRETYSIEQVDGVWKINNNRILGWLRKNSDFNPVLKKNNLLKEFKPK